MMDYSNYPLSKAVYAGSERKLGILIDGDEYMLKFQKDTAFGKRYNHISKYIGSHIYEMLGFDTQETYLGEYDGDQVVACKNFISKEVPFVPFNDVGESSLEFEECNMALGRIFPRINVNAIGRLIDSIEQITDTHKVFYKHMLKNRYEKILSVSYERLNG